MKINKIICVLLIIAAVLEVSSRIILSQIHTRKYDSTLIAEKLYAPTDGLRSNAGGTVWGRSFHTDEIGARRHRHTKHDKKRLLILGDEVTQGVGVGDDETFANLINDSSGLDVRNISLIKLCTPDYLRLLEDFSFAEEEAGPSRIEKVYLFISLDDIYCKVKPDSFPPPEGHHYLGRIDDILQRHSGLYELAYLLVHRDSKEKFGYDKNFYQDDHKVQGMVSDIAIINSLCREKSIEFELYILPYRAQLSAPYEDMPQLRLAQFLSQANIPFHDLLPDLKKAGRPLSLFLFADEVHLSVAGHKAVADAVMHR